MNYIYQRLIGLLLTVGIISCSDDQPKDPTIFPTTSETLNDFEQWLDVNYRSPYNIRFKYKLEDSETDLSYHFIPADSAKTAKLAIITKYLWFDAYAEVLGPEFMKLNAPRILVAIGTPGYTRQRTEVVGSADGGYKVILGKVNSLTDQALADYETMTTYYFHTMHHEFTHILNQKKPYSTDFALITKSGYVSGDWFNQSERAANRAGFVSPYAMQNDDRWTSLRCSPTTSPTRPSSGSRSSTMQALLVPHSSSASSSVSRTIPATRGSLTSMTCVTSSCAVVARSLH